MTPQTLKEIILKWQKKLRLEDWDIQVIIVKKLATNVLAKVNRYPNRKEVIMSFAQKTHQETKADWESTVIHELLHLKLLELGRKLDIMLEWTKSKGIAKIFQEEFDYEKEAICYDFERVIYQLDK